MGYPGQAQSCPFVNVLRVLIARIHALNVCVCLAPVHVHSHSDRCWTAIVMGFSALWAVLPSGGRDGLLAGCNCIVREAWKRRLCTAA